VRSAAEQAGAVALVGLAARASGVTCDVRADFPYGIYRYSSIPSPTLESGDVYARAKLRALEIRNSIQFIFEQLDNLPAPKPASGIWRFGSPVLRPSACLARSPAAACPGRHHLGPGRRRLGDLANAATGRHGIAC
jgi:hypothetical protein